MGRLLPPDARHVELVHAPDVISFHDEPVAAARKKTESSLVVGMKLVHEGKADAFVSAGNTGAVVAASLLYVHRIRGVQRPAICSIMPAVPSPLAFLDIGANAECRPEHLRQFAVMGQAFAREVMGIAEPAGRPALDRRGGDQGHAPTSSRRTASWPPTRASASTATSRAATS